MIPFLLLNWIWFSMENDVRNGKKWKECVKYPNTEIYLGVNSFQFNQTESSATVKIVPIDGKYDSPIHNQCSVLPLIFHIKQTVQLRCLRACVAAAAAAARLRKRADVVESNVSMRLCVCVCVCAWVWFGRCWICSCMRAGTSSHSPSWHRSNSAATLDFVQSLLNSFQVNIAIFLVQQSKHLTESKKKSDYFCNQKTKLKQ